MKDLFRQLSLYTLFQSMYACSLFSALVYRPLPYTDRFLEVSMSSSLWRDDTVNPISMPLTRSDDSLDSPSFYIRLVVSFSRFCSVSTLR